MYPYRSRRLYHIHKRRQRDEFLCEGAGQDFVGCSAILTVYHLITVLLVLRSISFPVYTKHQFALQHNSKANADLQINAHENDECHEQHFHPRLRGLNPSEARLSRA
jgi:hypothetical protein